MQSHILAAALIVSFLGVPVFSVHAESDPKDPLRTCPLFDSGASTRSLVDMKDDFAGSQIHFVYVIPSDGTDEALDMNGTLTRSINAFRTWLCTESNGGDFRIDTYNGMIDISFAQLKADDKTIREGRGLKWETRANANPYVLNSVLTALNKNGFRDPKKLYALYYGGTSNKGCGGAVEALQAGAVYLSGYTSDGVACSNQFTTSTDSIGYWEAAMLHEIFHSAGIVKKCAKHYEFDSHVSDDARDLMYGGTLPWQYDDLVLDSGNDDYFGSKSKSCSGIEKNKFFSWRNNLVSARVASAR